MITKRPIHVLHLIDPSGADWPAMDSVALLCRSDDEHVRHSVLLFGGSDDARLAAEYGLRTPDRLHPPGRRPERASAALTNYLEVRGDPDVFHAWSLGTLAACRLLMSPRVLTAPRGPGSPLENRSLGVLNPHPFGPAASTILFHSKDEQDAWSRVCGPYFDSPIIEVTRPPIDAKRKATKDRDTVRAGWGVPNRALVVGLVGEPQGACDARRLAQALSVLAVSGREVVGVMRPGARRLERALRYADSLNKPVSIVVDDAPIWEISGALDIAVWLGGGPSWPASVTELAWAVAYGVPVLAEDLPASREALGESGAFFDGDRGHALDEGLLRFFKDPKTFSEAQRSMSAEIRERHDPVAWVESMHELYIEAAEAGPIMEVVKNRLEQSSELS